MTWIALVLAVAVAVGVLLGGRLGNLAQVRLRGWPLLFLGVAAQVAAEVIPDDRSWSHDTAVWLLLASYLPLFAVVALNRSDAGMWLAGVGILANFTVIAANQGMPVLAQAAVLAGAESSDLLLDAKHVLADDGSALVFLADVIPVRPLRQVLSIGDVVLAIGIGAYIVEQLRRPLRYFRRTGSSEPGSARRT